MVVHKGGCHCGRVRFEVEAPADLVLDECNCSICNMAGYQHLIVPKSDFRILQGEDQFTTYAFNKGVAQHSVCSHCGVQSFYIPRSHPAGLSVTGRCLDPGTVSSGILKPFSVRLLAHPRD